MSISSVLLSILGRARTISALSVACALIAPNAALRAHDEAADVRLPLGGKPVLTAGQVGGEQQDRTVGVDARDHARVAPGARNRRESKHRVRR